MGDAPHYAFLGMAPGHDGMEYQVVADLPMGLFACDNCGAVVNNRVFHDAFHAAESARPGNQPEDT